MVNVIKLADSLDWPEGALETVKIQCAGKGYLEYQTWVKAGDDWGSVLENRDADDEDEEDDEEADDGALVEDTSPAIDLFALSEQDLQDIDFYQVLHLPYKPYLTQDDVKKAYRKACLKYHPDKSGRGEEDAVFLKVKAAFETLSTQKQAYDSTEMPFDDSLPSADETPAEDFFVEYGPVFERNLHFDARLLPTKGGKVAKNNRRKSKNNRHATKPPVLGDANTPIDKVHEFYDYWAHFESWRDFGLQAARELETQEHLENAESRYEKRWYQNQIDKRAKKLKQQEHSRITTLVERAMAVDPRLIQEKKRLMEEKAERRRQREQEALEKKRKEEEAKLAEERRIEEEKERKNQEKLQREKEKKLLRKTKQVFRKLVGEALEKLKKNEHALEEDVDMICSELNREQLTKLNNNLESKATPTEVLELVTRRALNVRKNKEEQREEEKQKAAAEKAASTSSSANKSASTKTPFTKEELSTLAKGVKKFPPGGANRWDQIAQYVNNVCRPQIPRTKEECIETFTKNAKSKPTVKNSGKAEQTSSAKAPSTTSGENDWTDEQDKQLQEGLAKFPATMDKNERWTNIANCVPGKTKKQCVSRFKAIRDAIKKKK